MDSATLRQEVSSSDSDLRAAQRDLTFATAEADNTQDQDKKDAIGNKIEKLKGDIGGAASRHSSAVQDLQAAEATERKEKLFEETEKQKSKEIENNKSEDVCKKPDEKEVNSSDKKPATAKKEPVLIGGELYDIKDSYEDPKIMQDILLAKLKEQVTPEAKDAHAEDTKDKPELAANIGATSTAPAIASTSSAGITQDTSTPTASSRIQGAAGSGSTST